MHVDCSMLIFHEPFFCQIHSRVIKTPAEIEVLRYVAKVSSDAHKVVMKTIKSV